MAEPSVKSESIDRVVLVHSDRGNLVDGIRDHSARMAEELTALGLAVETTSSLPMNPGGSARSTMVVVQYSPFCFARWGFAPSLPLRLLRLRARRRRPVIALMVHEPYVPIEDWRSLLMGSWQRLQLRALQVAADVVFTSIDTWAERLGSEAPRRPVAHLPVGSNLPDGRGARDQERARLGVGAETVVVASLGRSHPSWMAGHVVRAVNAVAGSGRPTLYLSLGAEAPALEGLDGAIESLAPGYLEGDELAAMLAAADLFLAPTIDGVSTRRGTLMAALQHQVPVLATIGPLTDAILRDSPGALKLIAVDDGPAYGNSALGLADDPVGRVAMGAAGRRLYEENFDWPVIARRMLDHANAA